MGDVDVLSWIKGRVVTGAVAGISGGAVIAAAMIGLQLARTSEAPVNSAPGVGASATPSSTVPSSVAAETTVTSTPPPTPVVPVPPIVRGTITVLERVQDRNVGGDMLARPGNCWAGDGYDDITRGTTVTIYDQNRRVIGSGALLRGSLVKVKREWQETIPGAVEGHYYRTGLCRFVFHIRLSGTADYYGVEVGRRGVVNFSAAVLRRNHNRVSLTLG